MFGPRVGFLKFRSTAKVNAGGEKGVITVPGIVFMRGGAVGVLVILECDGKEYTLLTNQARVPIGHHALSLANTEMLSAHDSFSGGRAGGAKASEDKGAEQFDNPVHGQAAEDS